MMKRGWSLKKKRFGLGIFALLLLSVSLVQWDPSSDQVVAKKAVQTAWIQLQQGGAYSFSTVVEQVTHPAPAITNAGKAADRQVYALDGTNDLVNHSIFMRLFQQDHNVANQQDAIEIRIEDGQAFGRTEKSEWVSLDSFSMDSFAPGNDFSSFLTSADNIRFVQSDTRELQDAKGGVKQVVVDQYHFDVDSNKFAAFMRDQMVAEFQRAGKLPHGMQLSISDLYLDMRAGGDIWVDSSGYPIRMEMHMQMPQEKSGERVEATIKTDFTAIHAARKFAGLPLISLAGSLGLLKSASDWKLIFLGSSGAVLFCCLMGLLLLQSGRKGVQILVSLLMIALFVFTPLWQSNQNVVFARELEQKQAAQENAQIEKEAEKEALATLYESDWNPAQDPRSASEETSTASVRPGLLPLLNQWAVSSFSGLMRPMTDEVGDVGEVDSDLDGLTDAYENQFDITVLDPNNPDTDGDGLSDGEEAKLGTSPGMADSDQDGISDFDEVNYFYYRNANTPEERTGEWYSNPMDRDSDHDNLLDGLECEERVLDGDTPVAGICRDSDADGIPDIFDTDDDNDGVPTLVDLDPISTTGAVYTASNPFKLNVRGVQADLPVMIEFQLRPANPKHLTYIMNVLDWPTSDTDGQIQRKSANTTYGDSLTSAELSADPRPGWGDMRLVPMLEIQLKNSIPMAFTNQFTTAITDADFSGTLTFTNPNPPAGMPSYVQLSEAPSQDYRIYYGSGDCDAPSGVTFLGNIANGVSLGMSMPLGDLAASKYSFLIKNLSEDKVLACVVPSHPHAGQVDQVVDTSMVDAYGGFVRDADTAGNVLVYMPLNMVTDVSGNEPVAFSGQLPLQNLNERLNNSDLEVRMVWLINMLTDVCKPMPESYVDSNATPWCDPQKSERWYQDSARVVHSYDDTFGMTGIQVTEDHGVQMAVVFEDPATDLDPQYDDPLWELSSGLQGSFLAGRADFDINEISMRFDREDGIHSSGDQQLWGIEDDALQVLNYSYDHFDGSYQFSTEQAQQLFSQYFPETVTSSGYTTTNLLFARQYDQRVIGLGESTASAGITTFNLASLALVTNRMVNWAPYRFEQDSWKNIPLDQYLDLLETRLRSLEDFQPSTDETVERNIVDGQIYLARYYYQALFLGLLGLTAVNGDAVISPSVRSDFDYYNDFNTLQRRGAVVGKIVTTIAEAVMNGLDRCTIAWLNFYAGDKLSKVEGFFQAMGDGLKQKASPITKHLTSTLKKAAFGLLVVLVVVAVVTCAVIALVAPNTPEGKIALKILMIGMNVLTIVLSVIAIKGAVELLRASKAITAAAQKATIIGAIIAGLITWGVFIYTWASSGMTFGSLAFNTALAEAIAATMLIVIMAALACTGVGAIIVGIVAIIDAIISSFCYAFGVYDRDDDDWAKQYVCIGISGWVTKIFAWLIYSNTYLVDYDNSDRIEFTSVETDLQNDLLGMTPSNKMKVNLGVRNTITLSDIPVEWMAAAYFWQYSNANAKTSTFNYALNAAEEDIHDALSRGTMKDLWQSAGSDKWKYEFSATTSGYSIAMPSAGINQDPTVYLAEGSALPVQECWCIPPIFPFIPVPIPVCYIRTEKATFNVSVGESLTMDIFPNTLDEFYDLKPAGNGKFSLKWDTGQISLKDADGDKLAWNQGDPDDSLYDTDADGLSDYSETVFGTNPRLFDTDQDGLYDRDELLIQTDPTRKDSDGDGLTDALELEGWLFTYGFYSDGSPKETMVFPNPLNPDTDLDGISDLEEKIYGFNPQVPEEANLLDYSLSFREMDAPIASLALDESGGTTLFTDASGFGMNAFCQEDHCPQSGFAGRYLNAVYFGGDDFLYLPSSSKQVSFLENQPFALASWVYPSADGTLIAKWQQGSENRQELELSLSGMHPRLSNANQSVTSSAQLAVDQWSHLVVSFDGVRARFYVNGTLVDSCQEGSCAWQNTATYPSESLAAPITLGASLAESGGPNNAFVGYLDEVQIFDHTLADVSLNEESFISTRLMAHRYNHQDGFVRPAETVEYTSVVKNLLNSRFAYGLLNTVMQGYEAVLDWASKLLPSTFVLYPDNPVVTGVNTLVNQETLQIDPAWNSSQILTIEQTASAQIVDRRTESNFAQLWLKFNETGSVSTFVDSSGNMPPRDATCVTCPSAGHPGMLNTAVQFLTGQDTPLTLPTLGRLNLLQRGFTIAFWVKPDASAFSNLTILKSLNNQFALSLQPTGANYRAQVVMNGTLLSLTSSRNITGGAWNHVVVKYNDGSQVVSVYVNGAVVAQTSSVAPLGVDDTLLVGGNPQGRNYLLDDLRIFNRPLTVLDINRLAERPVLDMQMETSSFGDSSNYGQSISVPVSSPTLSSSSIRGSSLYPSNGFVQVNGNSLLDMHDGTFTFSVWIYPQAESTSQWQGIFGKHERNDPNNTYPTLERNGAYLRFGYGTGSTAFWKQSGPILSNNTWYHITVTLNSNGAGGYEYRLYRDSELVDMTIFSAPPASRSTFFVGHSSSVFYTYLGTLYMDDEHDAGEAAEPYIYENRNGSYYHSVMGETDLEDGDSTFVNHGDTISNYAHVRYVVMEEDSTSADDYCGDLNFYWNSWPGSGTGSLSDGFDGRLTYSIDRPSIMFFGKIDELQVFRYAIDSEMVYDQTNAIPITARLPLDERPAADSFENKAFLGNLDDGTCSGLNCPAAGTIGLIDQAVRFDGQNDVITVPVATTSDYMVSMWVNSDCPNCGLYTLTHNSGTVLNQIYMRNGNVCAKAGFTELCSRNAILTDKQWHHVVYSNNNGVNRLWLDGVVVNQLSASSMAATGAGIASLGVASEAGQDYLNGQLDDVRVFRYSQDVNVIAQLLARAPLFLTHLDEDLAENGFEDATPNDWMLDCEAGACPQTDQAGRLGRSVSFDGVDDLLSLRQEQLSSNAQSFSVSLWVKPTDILAHRQTLWSLWNYTNTQIKYSLAIEPDSMGLCVRNTSTPTDCQAASNVDLVMNVWNHVTLVVSRTSATTEKYQLFINGYLDSSGNGLGGSTFISNGLGRLQLGDSDSSSLLTGAYVGLLDEVSVFTYELNEIDVRDTFHYQMEHVEETQSISMQIDADPPAVDLISFNPDFPYISELDRILLVDARDITAGIAAVEMTVSHVNMPAPASSLAPVCIDSASGTTFCPTLDPQAGDGTYSLSLRAIDAVGNQAISSTYDLLVDNGSPRLTANLIENQIVPAVLDPQFENTWRLELSGLVQDEMLSNNLPGSGLELDSIAISIYNEFGALIGAGRQSPTLTPETNGYRWAISFLFSENEPTGKLTLVVEADDRVGNHGELTVNFFFDATAPESALNESSMPITDIVQTLDGSKDVDQFALRQVMIGGSASDIPGLNLLYMTENGIPAATQVDQVDVSFEPALNASYLFNEPYPSNLLVWLPLDKEEIPAGTEGVPDANAPVRYYLDSSPYQIAGECQTEDCPMEGPVGHKNGSLYFNGNNKYINLGTQVNLANRSFSISVWANREETNRNDPILWQGPLGLANQRLLLGFNANNQMVCGFGGSDLVSSQQFDQPGWHNWGCSYDLSSRVRTIWLDGQALASDSINPMLVMEENLYVGLAPVGSFKGYLDELMVYDRALFAEEMRQQYTGYQYNYRLSVNDDFIVSGDYLDENSGFYQKTQLVTPADDPFNKVSAGLLGDYALRFTGTEKLVVAEHYSLNLNRAQFTQSAWVKASQPAAEAGIFSQYDENPEMRYPSLLLLPDGSIKAGFGNGYNWFSVQTEPGVYVFDELHFIAAVFDGQTYRLYLDGELVLSKDSLAGLIPYSNQTFAVGEGLSGVLDEISLFTRALSEEEIFAFYQMAWREANLENGGNQVTWNKMVPYGLEGPFDVNVRAWDGGGHFMSNQKNMTQWGGTVDSYPPRLTITQTEMDPEDSTLVAYDFIIEDTMLDVSSIHQNICESVTYQQEYFNSSWLLSGGIAPNSSVYRVSGHCEGVKPQYEEAGLSACDAAGNCIEKVYAPFYPFRVFLPLVSSDNPVPLGETRPQRVEVARDWPLLSDTQQMDDDAPMLSAWLEQGVLTYRDQRSIMHLNIQGSISSPQSVRSLEIKIWDGEVLLGITQAALVGNLWNAPWIFAPASPPPDGIYLLELNILDTSGAMTVINLPIELDLRP